MSVFKNVVDRSEGKENRIENIDKRLYCEESKTVTSEKYNDWTITVRSSKDGFPVLWLTSCTYYNQRQAKRYYEGAKAVYPYLDEVDLEYGKIHATYRFNKKDDYILNKQEGGKPWTVEQIIKSGKSYIDLALS